MEKLQRQLSYLKGLADGMEVAESSHEGKLINEMLKVMDSMVFSMRELQNRLDEQEEYMEAVDEDLADLEEYVEAIDEDLDDVEDFLFEEEDWEEDDDILDSVVDSDDTIYFDEDDADDIIRVDDVYDENAYDGYGYDDDDTGYFEIECPNCQELVAVDQDIFDNDMVAEVLCPECHEVILVNQDLEDEEGFDNYVIDDGR